MPVLEQKLFNTFHKYGKVLKSIQKYICNNPSFRRVAILKSMN